MEPTRGVTASLNAPTYALRWPEHRAYLPLSSGPLRVGQKNFEIHMHAPPVGPSRVLFPSGPPVEFRSNMTCLFTCRRPREGSRGSVFHGAPLLWIIMSGGTVLPKAQGQETGPTEIVPPALGTGS